MKIQESDLYLPIKEYLEQQGYAIYGEVKNCDITARKDDELILIELKTHFSVALLMQATGRQQISNSVYVAIPVPPGRKAPPNFRGMCALLKRLELGLILVRFLKTKTKMEVVFHPDPPKRRKDRRKRKSLIREMDGLYKDHNLGGIPSTQERITAYKQNAIQIATYLDRLGQASPAQLRKLGTGGKTQSILSKNHYGWFEKVDRGIYALDPNGRASLAKHAEIVRHFMEVEGMGETL
ncbi:MAG: DUF2161 family putative PD-(D/E)XK-type phosphodiesterase [Candidatus Latescibacterota bacterium]